MGFERFNNLDKKSATVRWVAEKCTQTNIQGFDMDLGTRQDGMQHKADAIAMGLIYIEWMHKALLIPTE